MYLELGQAQWTSWPLPSAFVTQKAALVREDSPNLVCVPCLQKALPAHQGCWTVANAAGGAHVSRSRSQSQSKNADSGTVPRTTSHTVGIRGMSTP